MMPMVRVLFPVPACRLLVVLTRLRHVLVLTKVVVYVCIGAIATVIVPAMFEALEWGV